MKPERERHNESALKKAGAGTGLVLLIATAVVVVAALMYFGLGGSGAPGA